MGGAMSVRLLTVLAAATLVVGCHQTGDGKAGNSPATPASGARAPGSAPSAPVFAAVGAPVAMTNTGREITIPAGTELRVTLDTAVGSDTSHVEQAITAHLTRAIHVQGQTVLAEGSRLSGVVTDATHSAKVKGLAPLAMRFNAGTPHGPDQPHPPRPAAGAGAAGPKKGK